ncbi:MAG: glycogen/starch synthase [Patescibacteria group bacterium]|nr:glycogen/starch synthase [Patescibacteria group bacterium]MDD4610552.1 glycogen/starch synthase [Patescibacteria group bacterium]
MKNKGEKLKILMLAAEAAPLVKVGGLGDVVGSLPPALARLGCDVRIIIPKYGGIDEKKYKLKKFLSDIEISTADKIEKINLWQANLPGSKVPVYFIENNNFFSSPDPYAGNNSEKFLFFLLAVMRVMPLINFVPDILHCHDFHVAMAIDLIKVENQYNNFFKKIKTLYTIHNLNNQGQTGIETLRTGNLNKNLLASLSRDSDDGDINFMVQGIINADLVNTVSPTYAKEISTSIYGAGLEKVIRQNQYKIFGILNGVDVNFFNPEKDKYIFKKYSAKTLKNKVLNKVVLQEKLGLEINAKKALAGVVTRFVWQKGLELFNDDLMRLDCQFVFLGTGEKKYEEQLKNLAQKYPRQVSAQITFDAALAQEIYAASDIFLVPSRFEPCGLTQMIAMRYGAVPIVRATGGLADTVDSKVGFKFKDFNTMALQKTLGNALKVFHNRPKEWERLQLNGMKKDFSWNKPAKEYLKLFQKLVGI